MSERICRECGIDTADRDGFCSDTCSRAWDASIAPTKTAIGHVAPDAVPDNTSLSIASGAIRADGRAKERARIVAWLRAEIDDEIADDVESGRYLGHACTRCGRCTCTVAEPTSTQADGALCEINAARRKVHEAERAYLAAYRAYRDEGYSERKRVQSAQSALDAADAELAALETTDAE